MPRLTSEQWIDIKAEWIAGTLPIRELARQFDVDHKTITQRAKREAWPPRNEVSDTVSALTPALVPKNSNSPQLGVNARIALQAFDRVIHLLRAHRQDIGILRTAVTANLRRVSMIIEQKQTKGLPLTLKQELMIAQILSASANAMARLIPLERKAFGLSQEEVSEFDSFTDEQLDAVLNTIRKAVG